MKRQHGEDDLSSEKKQRTDDLHKILLVVDRLQLAEEARIVMERAKAVYDRHCSVLVAGLSFLFLWAHFVTWRRWKKTVFPSVGRLLLPSGQCKNIFALIIKDVYSSSQGNYCLRMTEVMVQL